MKVDIVYVWVAFFFGGMGGIYLLSYVIHWKIKRADICDSDKSFVRDVMGMDRK